MKTLIADFDWASSPIGARSSWPAEVQILATQILAFPFPCCLCVGETLTTLYNDAYASLFEDRHPAALGRGQREIWPGVLNYLDPVLEAAISGKAMLTENARFDFAPNDASNSRWFTFSCSPVVAGEQVQALLLMGHETTSQVTVESDLRKRNTLLADRLRQTADDQEVFWSASLDLMSKVDHAGMFLDVNPAWTRLLGYEREELIGQPSTSIVVMSDVQSSNEARSQTYDEMELKSFQNHYLGKDGILRTILWTAISKSDCVYGIGKDITESVEAAAALLQAEALLRQAQKMEAIGHITGGLAHDFNNMLALVMGNLDLIKSRHRVGRLEEASEHIAKAQDAVRRAAALTSRLLTFAKRKSLSAVTFSPTALVASIADLLSHSLGPEFELVVEGGAEVWNILSDPAQLEAAILNLIINARKAVPTDGKVILRMRNVSRSETYGSVQSAVAEDFVEVSVSDTGVGMSVETLAQCTVPFFTTRKAAEGSGLGLSTVFSFVQQSNGGMHITSEQNVGTVVRLYFVRSLEGFSGNEHKDELPVSQHKRKKGSVLLITDEQDLRHVTELYLSELGYAVACASNGLTGLEILETNEFDLLVTDFGLPNGLSGVETSEAARKRSPTLRTLYITGYGESAFADEILSLGVDFLSKPYLLGTLDLKIQEILSRPKFSYRDSN